LLFDDNDDNETSDVNDEHCFSLGSEAGGTRG